VKTAGGGWRRLETAADGWERVGVEPTGAHSARRAGRSGSVGVGSALGRTGGITTVPPDGARTLGGGSAGGTGRYNGPRCPQAATSEPA